jgi:hypothetical protein
VPFFKELKSLEVLEIPATGLTGDGLAQLAGMTQLKKLYAAGNNLTVEQVAAFRAAAPHCELTWWPAPEDFERVEDEGMI